MNGFDLIVIGGGPGGDVAALEAAKLGSIRGGGRARRGGRHLFKPRLYPHQGAFAAPPVSFG